MALAVAWAAEPLARPTWGPVPRPAAPHVAVQAAASAAAGSLPAAAALPPVLAAAARARGRRRRRRRAARSAHTVPVQEQQAPAAPGGGGATWLRPLRRIGGLLRVGRLARLLRRRGPLPVTVLSGFLGSGKTTLLKRILRLAGEGGEGGRPLRVAVIVNDMGEVNLDASEIKNSRLIKEEATMVELHNGCICCTLRGDLLRTVRALSEERAFDYLVIESTGISEPLPVAQTFTMDVDDMDVVVDEAGEAGEAGEADAAAPSGATLEEVKSLSHYARLDTMVTVVDALNVFDVLGSLETLAEDNMTKMLGNNGDGEDERDERGIAQLLLDQIEFANVILLSKVDLVKREGAVEEIRALLQRLNPSARVVVPRPHFADLPLRSVINTRLFDMEEAEESAGWAQELAKHAEGGEGHTPETEEYGISSVVFNSAERPLHPGRLEALLESYCGSYAGASAGGGAAAARTGVFSGVVRAKGQLWMATANSFPVNIHVAGRHVQLEVNEPWLAAFPHCCESDDHDRDHDHDHDFAAIREEMEAEGAWDPVHGDRGSTVVFIGIGLDRAGILAELNAALLTDAEMEGGVASWKTFEDNFFSGDYFDASKDMEGRTLVLTE